MMIHIFLLSLASAIWGFGFIAARWSLTSYDSFWTIALRFLIAGGLSLPYLFYKNSFFRKKNLLLKSAISSVFLFGTLLFQTWGLNYTTVAKSGFITTLYSLLIPLMTMLYTGKRYRDSFWMLVFMALLGMALMCNLELKDLNIGDLLTLLAAFAAAFHIIYIGNVASHIDSPIEFNFLQNLFVAVWAVVLAFFYKGGVSLSPLWNLHSDALKGLLFLGIISSMISFSIQVMAQKKIPSHIAGLIFLMESPFAAIFGFYIFRETLNWMNIFGAILVTLSVILIPVLGREVTTPKKSLE